MSGLGDVPCNGCTACCEHDMILLHPELGDDPSQYQTLKCVNPLTGKPGHMLAHKPDGGCIYLGDNGCTIHGRAPAICREFDCRHMFLKLGAAAAKRAVAKGIASEEVITAGRRRRSTLTPSPSEVR